MSTRPSIALALLLFVLFPSDLALAQARTPNAGIPALSRDWKRVRSEHFVAVGNTGEGQLRTAVVELERFRAALVTALPAARILSSAPTVLVLFKNDGDMSLFKPRDASGAIRRNVAGYYLTSPEGNRMVSAVYPSRDDTYQVIFHEYAHDILHRSGRGLPLWVEEGLADFYGTFRTDGPSSGILGSVPLWRGETLRTARISLSFDEMFTDEGAANVVRSPLGAQTFYAEAWALTHFLTVGPRTGQLTEYLQALDRRLPPRDAFRAAFRVSFEDLQGELRRYLEQRRLPGRHITFSQLPAVADAVEPMAEADVLQIQGDLLLRHGALDDAEPLIRRLVQLEPSSVAGRLTLASLHRARQRHEDAISTLRGVVTDAPSNFGARYWLAHDLTSTDRGSEAMGMSMAAASLNSQSPDAWLQVSVAALSLGLQSQADEAMAKARAISPSPSWLFLRAQRLWTTGGYSNLVKDIDAYVHDIGADADTASYAAFLGVLASWRLQQPERAGALLAAVGPGSDPTGWTAVVTQFFKGSLPPRSFLERARGRGQQTEAHAYVGIKAAIDGHREEAVQHLQWVEEQGNRLFIEYNLAVAELKRIRVP